MADSWSVTLAGLSRHENSKVSNINFCCSDKVSAMDMCGAILVLLEKEGVEAYDAKLQQTVVVSPLM